MTGFATNSLDSLNISAESAILIDASTGDILYEKNGNKLMYPASTTKIMTAILTLENTNLKDKVIIDEETPFTEGSRIYVIEDEEFTVEQLLYALLVASANDAAVALAKHISGSIEEFAKLMNKRAKELGAKNTHFTNPNGLPDDEHVTTAYDLAMIAKYAMTIPKFREIIKTVRYQIPPTNKQTETRYLKNTNRLLWGVGRSNKILYDGEWINIKYDIVDGIKTGYTSEAQQCLVSTAQKNGRRLISVVLKAIRTNVYVDTRKLLDYGFENFKFIDIVNAGTTIKAVKVPNGKVETLDLITRNRLSKVVPIDVTQSQIDYTLHLNPEIKAPINKGEVLGKITYTLNGKDLGSIDLIASKSIDEKNIYKIIKKIKSPKSLNLFKFLFILFIFYILWRTVVTIRRLRRWKRFRK
jgi:D-alanyl-D-alanine carboxypeptidase (penicillin-binding protein 5/6)